MEIDCHMQFGLVDSYLAISKPETERDSLIKKCMEKWVK